MARSDDAETGKGSRKRLGLQESGVKERAKKKARPTENVSKLTRKRASSETEELDEDQDLTLRPSRKILKNGLESQSLSTVREESNVQEPDLSQRKWKRTSKAATSGDEKDVRRSAVGGTESESAGVEQKAHRKRREANKGEGSPLLKKLRIDDTRAEASHRVTSNTWKRQKRQNVGAASAEDMAVSISEAWKRLREKDTENNGSGSSVNGRGSDSSDLSMHSIPEQHRSKKARHVSPLRQPVEKKWKRQMREKKQSSSSKRQRDDQSSGSSGSDMAQSSYLHNRRWKRPRYENLMSAQGRSLRKQSDS